MPISWNRIPGRGLGAVIITFALCLGLAEMAVRVYGRYLDPSRRQIEAMQRDAPTEESLFQGQYPFSFRPGAEGRFSGIPVRINQAGFRDREMAPKFEGVVRIAVIGDSIVFGQGVFDSDTLSRKLEARLNAEARSGQRRIEVLNFGIPGATSFDELLIAERVLDFRPDIVIWVYCLNDPEFEDWNRDIRECIDTPLSYRVAQNLRQRSRLFDLVAARLGLLAAGFRYGYPSATFQEHQDSSPGFKCVRKSLKTAAELFKAHGIRALFTVYPMPYVVGTAYPFRSIHQKVSALAESEGFAVLDLEPSFAHLTPQQVMVSEFEKHPNGFANEVAAEALSNQLKNNGLLDPVGGFGGRGT